ncbi:hypothetical protein PHDIMM138B_20605 [Phytobacter diazotrophicus]|jgi:hypothetical protein
MSGENGKFLMRDSCLREADNGQDRVDTVKNG